MDFTEPERLQPLNDSEDFVDWCAGVDEEIIIELGIPDAPAADEFEEGCGVILVPPGHLLKPYATLSDSVELMRFAWCEQLQSEIGVAACDDTYGTCSIWVRERLSAPPADQIVVVATYDDGPTGPIVCYYYKQQLALLPPDKDRFYRKGIIWLKDPRKPEFGHAHPHFELIQSFCISTVYSTSERGYEEHTDLFPVSAYDTGLPCTHYEGSDWIDIRYDTHWQPVPLAWVDAISVKIVWGERIKY